MEKSAIEWTDHTFNPWEGCTKVSPGCANCYAETRNARWNGGTAPNWGRGAPRRRTSEANWNRVRKWNAEAAKYPPHIAPPRVFCASLADWLDPEVPTEWRRDLLRLIYETPHLDWLLLTKRPQFFHELLQLSIEDESDGNEPTQFIAWMADWLNGEKEPSGVWFGISAEDQERYDERMSAAATIAAEVRFISAEPLLGPIELRGERMPDWVIVGGESGPGARPMNPEWATDLRDQCAALFIPFFFKQWGGTNKKTTGRLLDGQVYDQLPAQCRLF